MKKTYSKPAIARAGVLGRIAANLSGQIDSDRRLKSNIAQVGTTVFGLPLYRFSYLGSSEQMFTGVMAQDVLGVMPGAVSRNAAGFYRVDYRMLGIEMERAA
jgi:Chaperone of endosialidase